MRKITVEWAYPTSDLAREFGYPLGCYTVQVSNGKKNKTIVALASREAAEKHAEKMAGIGGK